MNILGYMQFFDGLAEKMGGTFLMERVSSKVCDSDFIGDDLIHHCEFKTGSLDLSCKAPTRKEALKRLYRKLK